MALESAIPPHLTQERTIPVKTPANYAPPFPAYSARFPASVKDLVMAVIGAQYTSGPPQSSWTLARLYDFIGDGSADSCRPEYNVTASVTDKTGAYNEVLIAYWRSKAAYTEWAASSGFDEWWRSLDPETEAHGCFLEVFFPSIDRFETVFSNDVVPEGAAHMRESASGAIREHVYWGSMRDRLPAAQTDGLNGEKGDARAEREADAGETSKRRVRVPGRKNLAVIRSGQDWSNTTPSERELYLQTMHPVLVRGMDYLRDHGGEVGCISNRFMSVVDPSQKPWELAPTDKTFGLSYFSSLADLEGWSKHHQTHLDIFGGFLKYAKDLQNNVSLRLFHEVLVLEPDQQFFEYINCHNKTGMLAAM